MNLAEERVVVSRTIDYIFQEGNTSRQQEKEDKIKTNLESIESVKAEKEKYELQLIKEESNLVGVDNHKELLTSLRQTQSDTKSELKSAAKELKFFKTHDECPTCSQEIEKAFKNAVIGGLEGKGKKLTKEI